MALGVCFSGSGGLKLMCIYIEFGERMEYQKPGPNGHALLLQDYDAGADQSRGEAGSRQMQPMF